MNLKLVTILGLTSILLTATAQAAEVKTIVCKSQDFIYKLQKKDDGFYWLYAAEWPTNTIGNNFASNWQHCEIETENSRLVQAVCASSSNGQMPKLGNRLTLFKNGKNYSFKRRLFIEGNDSSNWERVQPSQVERFNKDIADGLSCELNGAIVKNSELMK